MYSAQIKLFIFSPAEYIVSDWVLITSLGMQTSLFFVRISRDNITISCDNITICCDNNLLSNYFIHNQKSICQKFFVQMLKFQLTLMIVSKSISISVVCK